MIFSIPIYACLFLGIGFFAKLLLTRYSHPLAKYPGPWLASVTRLWLVSHWYYGDMHECLIKLHRENGDFVRIAPNELSVASPDGVKIIYGPGSAFTKSDYYKSSKGNRSWDMLNEQNAARHAQLKRIVGSAYSLSSLMDLEPFVDKTAERFQMVLSRRAETGEVVDMNYCLQLYAWDVISELTFSKSFKFLESGDDEGTFDLIDRARDSSSWIGFFPEPFWIAWRLLGPNNKMFAISNRNTTVAQFSRKQVEERIHRKDVGRDFVSRFMKIQQEKGKETFSNTDLVFQVNSNVFAGSDTTAITLRAIFYYLLKHPSTYDRLVEEVDSAQAAGLLSEPITYVQAEKLEYLRAVIKEALRIHSAVGYTLPRVVPPGGTVLGGVQIPEGVVVGMSPWVIHRNRDIFGNDCDSWNPDRWLDSTRTSEMTRHDLAFGGTGSRVCIGRHISLLEITKLVPTLLRDFRFELENPQDEWRTQCRFFVKQKGLRCRVYRRKSK